MKEREKGRRKKSEICVDHDHKTMRVRGLLCVQCNFLIGHAKEDVSILNSAIIYVKELCTNSKWYIDSRDNLKNEQKRGAKINERKTRHKCES